MICSDEKMSSEFLADNSGDTLLPGLSAGKSVEDKHTNIDKVKIEGTNENINKNKDRSLIKANNDSDIDSDMTFKTEKARDDKKESKDEKKKSPNTYSSIYPEFISVIQFIQIFGPLLGIPKIPLEVIEDGLDTNDTKQLYYEACINSVERLLVCLLRRIGASVTLEKLTPNLKTFLYQKRSDLLTEMGDTVFRELPNKHKLDILNFICLSQFDDNQVFKSDITSNLSPDDLRLTPLGWDFESNQYWYISEKGNTHRLYRWNYPYSKDDWVLLTRSRDELQKVVGCLAPPNIKAVVDSKLGTIVTEREEQELEEEEAKQVKKHEVKKPRKSGKADNEAEEDKNVEHKVKRDSSKVRKSSRNVDRKVYTESDRGEDDTNPPETYAKFKKFDEKLMVAVEIARNRKRSKIHPALKSKVRAPPSSLSPLGDRLDVKASPLTEDADESELSIHDKISRGTPFTNGGHITNIPHRPAPQTTAAAAVEREHRPQHHNSYNINSSPKQHLTEQVSVKEGSSEPPPVASTPKQTALTKNNGDPFAFTNEDGPRQSKVSVDKDGVGRYKFEEQLPRNTVIYRPGHHGGSSIFDEEFLKLAESLPSLKNYTPPEQAEDVCWKCNGTDNVDRMLFCDGCDLATYHMECLKPPLLEIPDDDWFCPICQQCLLFLSLRGKLRVLNRFATVEMARKPASRPSGRSKSVHTIRAVSIPHQRHVTPHMEQTHSQRRPFLAHRQQPRPSTPSHKSTSSSHKSTSSSSLYRPHGAAALSTSNIHPKQETTKIRPPVRTIPATQFHKSTVIRHHHPPPTNLIYNKRPLARPRISKINHLMEVARKVYDHGIDDDINKDSVSEVSRDGYDSASTSSTEEMEIGLDDIPDDDNTSVVSSFSNSGSSILRTPPKRPLTSKAFVRNRSLHGSDKDSDSSFSYDDVGGTSVYDIRRARDSYHQQESHTVSAYKDDYNFEPTPRSELSVNYDDDDYKTNTSRYTAAGNVVTDTNHLSDAQKKALAAWEDMERSNNRHDEFEFRD